MRGPAKRRRRRRRRLLATAPSQPSICLFPGRGSLSARCQPVRDCACPARRTCAPSACCTRRSRRCRPVPMRSTSSSPAWSTSTWLRPASWSCCPPACRLRLVPHYPRRPCSGFSSCAGPRPGAVHRQRCPPGQHLAQGHGRPQSLRVGRRERTGRRQELPVIISDLTGSFLSRLDEDERNAGLFHEFTCVTRDQQAMGRLPG